MLVVSITTFLCARASRDKASAPEMCRTRVVLPLGRPCLSAFAVVAGFRGVRKRRLIQCLLRVQ